jgi:hypothetical protein
MKRLRRKAVEQEALSFADLKFCFAGDLVAAADGEAAHRCFLRVGEDTRIHLQNCHFLTQVNPNCFTSGYPELPIFQKS